MVHVVGGATYGPRLLADLTPALVLGAVPMIGRVRSNRSLRALFVATALWSMLAHWIGAFYDDGSWNARPVSVDHDPGRLWHVTDNPLIEDFGKIALGAMKQVAPIPEPVEPAVERRLLSRIDADPDSDRCSPLSKSYAAAQDENRVEGIRARRARHFSPQTAADLRFEESSRSSATMSATLTVGASRSPGIGERAETCRRLPVFAHFTGPGGRFQDDYFPRVLTPEFGWEAGETVKNQQTIAVPDSIPDGVYELRIGVWDPITEINSRSRRGGGGRRRQRSSQSSCRGGRRLTVSPGERRILSSENAPREKTWRGSRL